MTEEEALAQLKNEAANIEKTGFATPELAAAQAAKNAAPLPATPAPAPASATPAIQSAPISAPSPAASAPRASSNLTPVPVSPGERDALIKRYTDAGYTPSAAAARVNELWAGRPGYEAAPVIPDGYVQINGAQYPTTAAQQAAYENIQVIGQPGQPGSYLIGRPKQQSIALPGGTMSVDMATGDVKPGGDALASPDQTMPLPSIQGVSAAGTSTDALTKLISDFELNNKNIQDQILASGQPTDREIALQKKIDDLTAAFDKGNANIEGRAIPIEDIAGQEAQLLKNTKALLDPLQAELTRETNARTSKLNALTQGLGFQVANENLTLEKAKLIQQPLLDAQKNVQDYIINLATKYPDAGITMADSAETAAGKVAKNSALYAKEVSSSAAGADPTSYREWQLAGSPGTYLQFLKDRGVPAQATADQNRNAGFALRAGDSDTIINQFGYAAAGLSGAGQALLPDSVFTNWLKSPEYQQLDQAERDFVNAVLRRESGAVISNQEFDNARKQYFPTAGDSKAVIDQKAANRLNALRGIALSSGPALTPTFVDDHAAALKSGIGGGTADVSGNADIATQINEARAAGYSDKQTFDYMVQHGLITPPSNQEVDPTLYLNRDRKSVV